jgi:hypothetical protein
VARYRCIYRNGEVLAEYENDVLVYVAPEAVSLKRSDLPSPYVIRDIGEYVSPIDNSTITSRSTHREHLKVHDVIEVGNERLRPVYEPVYTRDIGNTIKYRLDEVKSLPQAEYDAHVQAQAAEHAQIASSIKASPDG